MYDLSRVEIQIVESKVPAVTSTDTITAAPLIGGTWIRGGTHEAISAGSWSTAPASAVAAKRGQKYAPRLLP